MSLHERSKENGLLLIDFAAERNLRIIEKICEKRRYYESRLQKLEDEDKGYQEFLPGYYKIKTRCQDRQILVQDKQGNLLGDN